MESRLERYKRRKREKRIKLISRLMLLFIIVILILSLNTVDKSYRTFLCIENQRLFDYEYIDDIHNIQLFGNAYLIEQRDIDMITDKIKETIKTMLLELKNKIEVLAGQSKSPVF